MTFAAHLHLVITDDGTVVGALIMSGSDAVRFGSDRISTCMREFSGRGSSYEDAVRDVQAQVGAMRSVLGRPGTPLRAMFDAIAAGGSNVRLGGKDISR